MEQAPESRAVAPVDTSAGIAAAMPTALALYLNDGLFERVSQVAARLSKAAGITPKHLVGQPEACFAVVSRAITWRLDPFAVAMATYQTPGGQIGFEGKLVLAILESSGRLAGGVRFEHYGDWSHVQGRFQIRESQKENGKSTKYAVPTWSDDDARAGRPSSDVYPLAQSCGVRVSARLHGEQTARHLDFDLIQAQPRNSTLWATDPKTQICYTAARRFANAVMPALMMGVPFDPLDNAPTIDITPTAADAEVIELPRARSAAQAAPASDAAPATETPAAVEQEPQDAQEAAPADDPPPSAEAGAPELELSGEQSGARIASQAQRDMIVRIAKRGGLTVAQLDEHLVRHFKVGVDELPLDKVGEATRLLKELQAA